MTSQQKKKTAPRRFLWMLKNGGQNVEYNRQKAKVFPRLFKWNKAAPMPRSKLVFNIHTHYGGSQSLHRLHWRYENISGPFKAKHSFSKGQFWQWFPTFFKDTGSSTLPVFPVSCYLRAISMQMGFSCSNISLKITTGNLQSSNVPLLNSSIIWLSLFLKPPFQPENHHLSYRAVIWQDGS